MTSAESGQNQVMTHAQARRFLDARFIEVRERAIARLEGPNPCALAIFLEVLNRKWAAAIRKVAQARLPQKRRQHKYRATTTINRKSGSRAKVRPRDSLVYAEQTGGRKPSRKRSHHAGEYVPKQPTRGRPKASKEERKKWQQTANRKRRGKRAAARIAANKPLHRRKVRRASLNLQAGRAAWKAKHFLKADKDKRANHDTRYAYKAPSNPERRTAKEVKARKSPRKRHEGTGNRGAFAILIARRFIANRRRAKAMRTYWAFVRRNSK